MALDADIVDPREHAPPEIAAVFAQYPHIGPVLPALGYDPAALEVLQRTINATDADVVVAGTPIDLARAIDLNKPVVRAHYAYQDAGDPGLMNHIDALLKQR
jgi:predicted GTPase